MNQPKPGPIAWMAKNSVAANLLMLFLAVGGLIMLPWIRQEVFPRIQLDSVQVRVPYPGASPEEVEEGIVLAVEEAIRGTEGVDEVRATASEGLGLVVAELLTGSDADQALNDIESAVGRITTFPEEAEEPVISLSDNARQVLSVIVAGPVRRVVLDHVADALRDRLLASGDVTQVDISGLPPPELEIAVTQAQLRRYDLSPPEIAEAIRQASLELAAGSIETSASDIRLRVARRADTLERLREVVVIAGAPGVRVTLGMIATLRDTYRDTERAAWLGTDPAVSVDVYRIGPQAPDQVSEAVHEAIDRMRQHLPEALRLHVWNDASDIYQARVSLLIENGILGLLLVLGLLSLTLHPRVAFWVTLGMPVSFLSAFLAMAAWDVSINMISLFAFILVLGIVVDDAIVVGENIHSSQERGLRGGEGVVRGAQRVAQPVVFAVLTTVMAFMPMLFISGVDGQIWRQIPVVVIGCLMFSLVESLLVLPAHLSMGRHDREPGLLLRPIHALQNGVTWLLYRFIRFVYRPLLHACLDFRYATIAVFIATLILAVGLIRGGMVRTIGFPRVAADFIRISVSMPVGSHVSAMHTVIDHIEAQVETIRRDLDQQFPAEGSRVKHVVSTLSGASNASLVIELDGVADFSIDTRSVQERLRRLVGDPAGVKQIEYRSEIGRHSTGVTVEFSAQDMDALIAAASAFKSRLSEFEGVYAITDTFSEGKDELILSIRPEAQALGLRLDDLARQVRQAFFGAEAQRIQRGRDEVKVWVRYPEAARDDLA
ncbi:MAG: efflux RND transporter permease subunit, partial [Planctomycetota bacterium]